MDLAAIWIPLVTAFIGFLAKEIYQSLKSRFRRRRAAGKNSAIHLIRAVVDLLVTMNRAIDRTRANPHGNDDRFYSAVFDRYMATWPYLPKHLWGIDGDMRKHLDALWAWRAQCKALPPGAPIPAAPRHEDLMDLLRPYMERAEKAYETEEPDDE